ncbi:oligosaccharide flippase family protein [Megamonas funiformis]
MNKIKLIYNKYKKIIKNIWWLYLVQGVNYIFPLLTIPYLIRVVGTDYYGFIAIMQAIMNYLNVIVDYGFNLTSTRKIALNKNNKEYVNKEFNNVISIKILLMILCFILLCIFIFVTQDNNNLRWFYILSYSIVIGNTLLPIFFFRGMEDMVYISIINGISKFFYLILLLIFVQNINDFVYVGLVQGTSALLGSIISLYFLKKKYKLIINIQFKIKNIIMYLKEGSPVFISNCCGNIYVQGATIIVGIFATSSQTAYFSLANKIASTASSLFQPFVGAIYPDLCQKYKNDKKEFISFLYTLFKITICIIIICILIMHIGSPYMSYILKGDYDEELILAIKYISFAMAGTMLNIFLHPFILAIGEFKAVRNIYFKVSIIFLLLSPILSDFFNYIGMMVSLMIVEYSIVISYLVILKRYLKINKG